MKKILGICGEPSTGKTTLMRCIMNMLHSDITWLAGKYRTLEYMYNGNIVVLGMYRGETFDGTDRLSMAVIEDAEQFLKTQPYLAEWILFEGDRLFCARWIKACIDSGADCKFVQLSFSPAEFNRRYAQRMYNRTAQSAAFIKSRRTKYQNLRQSFPFIELRRNDNSTDQSALILECMSWLQK